MKKICMFIMLVTSLSSCVKDVILDAKGAPRVTEAMIVLSDLTEGREGRFVQVNDILWRQDYSAIPTHHYRLEVTVPDRDPVWAKQTMPAEPPVESERYLFGDIFFRWLVLKQLFHFEQLFNHIE